MNKTDLVAAVSAASDTSKTDAAKAVDGVFGAITDALTRGDNVQIVGFGNFSVADRSARQGRNPKRAQPSTLPRPSNQNSRPEKL